MSKFSLDKEFWTDLSRMSLWSLFSALLYGTAMVINDPQIQTLLWKVGHVTVSAHLGYWISRKALGRLYDSSPTNDRIARAIIIGASMLSVATGL